MPKWNELSRYQQKTARTLHTKLSAAGILTSVTQVGAHLDDAEAWNDGAITAAELSTRTGWDLPTSEETPEPEQVPTEEPAPQADILPTIKARAARIAKLAVDLRDERAALRDDITTADQNGIGINEIARAADGGLSRPKVFEHLGQVDMMGRIREALRAADITTGSITTDNYTVDLTAKGGDVLITITGPHSGPDTQRDRDLYALDDTLKARGLILGYRDGGALPPIEWMMAHQDAEMVIYKV